jgi:hypothetical protein
MVEEHILVEPKVMDNAAYSAWEALTRLGFAKTLRGVRRAWLWEVVVSGPNVDKESLRRALENCDVLANPNKHRVSFVRIPCLEKGEVVLAVRDRDDGIAAATFTVMRDRLGFVGLQRLARLQMWILRFEHGGVDAARAAAHALLVNSHFQTYTVMAGDVEHG